MNFTLSDDQQMLRDAAREFLSAQLPLERVVELAESGTPDRSLWRQLAELGWTGISVAEGDGGAGLDFLAEALVIEELGRSLFPGPYFSTVGLALPALTCADGLLRAVLQGAPATLAWVGTSGDFAIDDLATTAEASGDVWRLSGTTLFVPDLALADIVVVAAQSGDGPGLWAIEKDGGGVRWAELPTVDATRRLGELVLDGAPARLLAGPGAEGTKLLRSILDRGRAALSAEAVGVADRALELAVEHARTRRQFGREIGSFQAVSHELADAYVRIEGARSLAYWAAWEVTHESADARVAASAAKASASECAVSTCERAIQVLGGVGFTWEHPLHRFYKRALWIAAYLGWPAAERAQVASSLVDRELVGCAASGRDSSV